MSFIFLPYWGHLADQQLAQIRHRLLTRFDQANDIIDRLNRLGDPGLHGRRHAKRLMR